MTEKELAWERLTGRLNFETVPGHFILSEQEKEKYRKLMKQYIDDIERAEKQQKQSQNDVQD